MKKLKKHIGKRTKIQSLEAQINKLQEELRNNNESTKNYTFCCGICETNNNVPQLNTSCGHTYCENCWSLLHKRQCPSCRTPIEKLVTNYALRRGDISTIHNDCNDNNINNSNFSNTSERSGERNGERNGESVFEVLMYFGIIGFLVYFTIDSLKLL